MNSGQDQESFDDQHVMEMLGRYRPRGPSAATRRRLASAIGARGDDVHRTFRSVSRAAAVLLFTAWLGLQLAGRSVDDQMRAIVAERTSTRMTAGEIGRVLGDHHLDRRYVAAILATPRFKDQVAEKWVSNSKTATWP
jgi:hypothetical protein